MGGLNNGIDECWGKKEEKFTRDSMGNENSLINWVLINSSALEGNKKSEVNPFFNRHDEVKTDRLNKRLLTELIDDISAVKFMGRYISKDKDLNFQGALIVIFYAA